MNQRFVQTRSKALDQALKKIKDNDSVVSVSKFNMFNPLRAYNINSKGKLETFKQLSNIKSKINANDKNTMGDIFFCNGNFWIFKRSNLFVKSKIFRFPDVCKKELKYTFSKLSRLDLSSWITSIGDSPKYNTGCPEIEYL